MLLGPRNSRAAAQTPPPLPGLPKAAWATTRPGGQGSGEGDGGHPGGWPGGVRRGQEARGRPAEVRVGPGTPCCSGSEGVPGEVTARPCDPSLPVCSSGLTWARAAALQGLGCHGHLRPLPPRLWADPLQALLSGAAQAVGPKGREGGEGTAETCRTDPGLRAARGQCGGLSTGCSQGSATTAMGSRRSLCPTDGA